METVSWDWLLQQVKSQKVSFNGSLVAIRIEILVGAPHFP